MTPLETARIVLALLLALLTGRNAIPRIALRLRPDRIRCWFLPSGEEATLLERSPALLDGVERLKRLHYFLIGVKVEKLPLWGRRFTEVALAARDQSAFASIVLQPFGAPASLYFYTPLMGGGMVFTRDYAAGGEVESAKVSVRDVSSEDIEVVHHAHQDRVAALRARGLMPEIRPSQAGRIAATHAFYASAYFRRRSLRLDLPAWFSFAGSMVLMAWALLAPAFGW
jgi:hypothetical protein